MRAVRLHCFGPPENLVVDLVPDPEPGPGQVRVRVAVAGVHVLDTIIRSGGSGGPFPLPELPTVPGREVAGVVDAVGPHVDAHWSGRRVVAHLGAAGGGYAEAAVVPVASLHEVPIGMGDDVAVAMIGTGRTAFGVLEAASLTADDIVVVTAAAGGLGSLLVQLARRAGATVVGVAGGPRKVEVVRRLGADVGVDYECPGWESEVRRALGGREVSVVLCAVGGELGRGALSLPGAGGRVVVYGFSGGAPASLTEEQRERGIEAVTDIGARITGRPGGMRELEDLALGAAGWGEVQPVVGQGFRLADAAAAHRAIESRSTIGKTVLRP